MNNTNPYYPGMWPNGTGYPGTYQTRVAQTQNNILKVAGPESAMAYPLGPNSNVVLFNATEPEFYIVNTDDSGYKNIRTFPYTEKTPEPSPKASDIFATKEELTTLQTDLADIKAMLSKLV